MCSKIMVHIRVLYMSMAFVWKDNPTKLMMKYCIYLESSSIQDFAILCKRFLGRWAQVTALVFSVLTLLGASIVYWVLMSNFMYHTVDFIHQAIISDVSPFESNLSDGTSVII
jgi:hypothetical protein